jgi:hypothetical protein
VPQTGGANYVVVDVRGDDCCLSDDGARHLRAIIELLVVIDEDGYWSWRESLLGQRLRRGRAEAGSGCRMGRT